MALIDTGIGGYIKIGIAVAAAAAIGLAYWHYTSVVGDLAKAQAQLSTVTSQRDAAVKLANDNADQVIRADQQREAAVKALEELQAQTEADAKESQSARDRVMSSTSDRDGPLAPVLEDLLTSRFGGTK